MGFTVKGQEGNGIGKSLRLFVHRVAKGLGFKEIVVEATHPATQAIWLKYVSGSSVAHEIDPRTFVTSTGTTPWKLARHVPARCKHLRVLVQE
jgi:hypothetical protein